MQTAQTSAIQPNAIPGSPIPITELDPSTSVPSGKSITGIVVLLWPYSSHTDSLALLLAEPDFRLRSRKGQVRVQLRGRPAQRAALAGIGIGDRVTLALENAVWAASSTAVATPGRSVEGELLFARRIAFTFTNDADQTALVNVEAETAANAETVVRGPDFAEASPSPPAAQQLFITPARTRRDADYETTWNSPYFPASTTRKSSSFLSRDDEIFADDSAEDYDALAARGSKRTKFARKSGQWRFDASSPHASSDEAASDSDHDSAGLEPADTSLADRRATFGVVTGAHRSSPVLLDSPSPQDLQTQTSQANKTISHSPQDFPTRTEPHVESNPGARAVELSTTPVVLPDASKSDPRSWGRSDNVSVEELEEPRSSTPPQLNTASSPALPSPSSFLVDSQIDFWRAETSLPAEKMPQSNAVNSEALFAPHGMQEPLFGLDGSFASREHEQVDFQNESHEHADTAQPIQEHLIPEKARKLSIQSSALFGNALNDKPPADVREQTDSIANTLEARGQPLYENAEFLSSTSQDKMGSLESQDIFEQFLVTSPIKEGANAGENDSFPYNSISEASKDAAPLPVSIQEGQEFPLTPTESQEQRPVDASSHVHPVDQILSGRLPITPKPTSSNLSEMLHPQSEPQFEPRGDDARPPSEKEKRVSRRLLSTVPQVVSPWFSSRRSSDRRSSRRESNFEGPNNNEENVAKAADSAVTAKEREEPVPDLLEDQLPKSGLRTPLSYYAPLRSLKPYISVASSQGASTVDIIAVAASRSSEPLRAKAGPRDFHTFLHVTDVSIAPKTLQVQCFRPFALSLPQADAGDVILLRDFVVKARKSSLFLLSASSSAWHTWKFKHPRAYSNHDESPSSSDISGPNPTEQHEEECRGPPVELGEEELLQALALRRWWIANRNNNTRDPESRI